MGQEEGRSQRHVDYLNEKGVHDILRAMKYGTATRWSPHSNLPSNLHFRHPFLPCQFALRAYLSTHPLESPVQHPNSTGTFNITSRCLNQRSQPSPMSYLTKSSPTFSIRATGLLYARHIAASKPRDSDFYSAISRYLRSTAHILRGVVQCY